LPDYLTMPQALAWERALEQEDVLRAEHNPYIQDDANKAKPEYRYRIAEVMSLIRGGYVPAILQIVSEWHLSGLPERMTFENFPGAPKIPAHDLMSWLIESVGGLYVGEEVPNV
jgi:hypothetical protein